MIKVHYTFMKILTGSDLSRRRLPVMSALSDVPGPVVWLTACGHGDEVCGIAIVQEVFREVRRGLLRGAVHAFPLMNPIGFETASRNIPVSQEDLNRSFPGEQRGSLGRRIAERILSAITETKLSLVLDLHNDWIKSIPYVLIDHNFRGLDPVVYAAALGFARDTGFVLVGDTEDFISTLSYNLLKKGVPALTLELGEPRVINERNVQYGVGAIRRILAKLDMLAPASGTDEYPLPEHVADGRLLQYSDKPYSSTSGIVRFIAKPGSIVKVGQPLAKIVNAFGKHQETVRAAGEAVVLGHSDSAAVFPGMPLMAFGLLPE